MERTRSRTPARCPLCREALDGVPTECPGCQTGYHPACLDELGGCSTLGCPEQGKAVSHLAQRLSPERREALRRQAAQEQAEVDRRLGAHAVLALGRIRVERSGDALTLTLGSHETAGVRVAIAWVVALAALISALFQLGSGFTTLRPAEAIVATGGALVLTVCVGLFLYGVHAIWFNERVVEVADGHLRRSSRGLPTPGAPLTIPIEDIVDVQHDHHVVGDGRHRHVAEHVNIHRRGDRPPVRLFGANASLSMTEAREIARQLRLALGLDTDPATSPQKGA